jgi:hypothetical protein
VRRLARMIRRCEWGVPVAALLLVALAGRLDAQIMRRQVRASPPNWVGGGVSILQAFSLQDGTTGSTWRFDSGLGYTASFEHPTSGGMMIGLQGTYARPSMIYTQNSSAACSAGCDATGTITQLQALIHSGNGYAFHPVYQLTFGATGFSNFRDQADTKVGPPTTDYDFSFAIGYGLGFGLSSNVAIEVTQELGTVLHQRDGLAAGSGNYPRIGVTRLGGKISF